MRFRVGDEGNEGFQILRRQALRSRTNSITASVVCTTNRTRDEAAQVILAGHAPRSTGKSTQAEGQGFSR